jgi:hypothetical protein
MKWFILITILLVSTIPIYHHIVNKGSTGFNPIAQTKENLEYLRNTINVHDFTCRNISDYIKKNNHCEYLTDYLFGNCQVFCKEDDIGKGGFYFNEEKQEIKINLIYYEDTNMNTIKNHPQLKGLKIFVDRSLSYLKDEKPNEW